MRYSLVASALLAATVSAQSKPTYLPGNLPNTTEPGQTGTNRCLVDSPDARCQNLWINSVEDFCLFAPPEPNSTIGETEPIVVAYCTQPGHGSRVIPAGTFVSAHWITTPSYIQITGYGDFTRINVQAGDAGGELDAHGASGLGNPIGSLIFAPSLSNASIPEWSHFMSATEYCIRVCVPAPGDRLWCNHIYDVLGCNFNQPGSYAPGFDQCLADNTSEMPGRNGIYRQGDGAPPPPPPAAATSSCRTIPGISPTSTSSSTSSLAVPTTLHRMTPSLLPSRATILPASATQTARNAVVSSGASKKSAALGGFLSVLLFLL